MSASNPQGRDAGRAYSVMKAPGWVGWMPESFLVRGKSWDGQMCTDALSVSSNVVVQKYLTHITPGFSILGGWPLLFSLELWGLYPV
jgi:hypothetical protein